MGEHVVLTIFSICLQAAVGIMVFTAIGRLINRESTFKSAVITAAVLGIIGMVASTMHLGRPLHAMNALIQFGSSWLSREIWSTALFIGLTVVAALLFYVKPQATKLITGIVVAAALIGVSEVFFMATTYSFASVPVWKGLATYVEFYAASISMGGIIFLALSMKEVHQMRKIVALSVVAVIAVQLLVVVLHFITIDASASTALQASLEIFGSLKVVTYLKWLLILVGAGMMFLLAKDTVSKSMYSAATGVALILMGQIMGRYVFYAIQVVSGVGLT